MAERRTGPVKPPTIDLTARDTGSATPMATAKAAAAEPTPEAGVAKPTPEAAAAKPARSESPPVRDRVVKDPAPPSPPRSRSGFGGLATAAVVGAILGAALTYALSTVLPLPAPEPPDAGPALAAHDQRLAGLEQELATLEADAASAGQAAKTADADLGDRVAALETQLADVSGSIPKPVDLSALDSRITALSAQVDAIAAGASSADAGAMAETITALKGQLAGLQATVDSLSTLPAAVAALEARPVPAPEPEAPAVASADMQVPLIVAGLETAFATGRPFATELVTLNDVLPDVAVAAPLAARAAGGLPRPDLLQQNFSAAVPDMLAARPQSEGWKSAGDWLASILALRPAGAVEGNTPDAVLSRLEAAIAAQDYAQAETLFAALPPPMIAAAGPVVDDVSAAAAAAALLADLRSRETNGSAT